MQAHQEPQRGPGKHSREASKHFHGVHMGRKFGIMQTLASCYDTARNESFIQLIYITIQANNGYDNKCQN